MMKIENGTRIRRCFGAVSVVAGLAGCSDGGEAALNGTTQAINNGDEVTSNVAPYSSVVRLHLLGGAGDLQGTCSAVKIGPTRYLTAAHCLQGDNFDFVGPGDTIDVSNALDGIGSGTDVTVSAAFYHPSYIADFEGAGDEDVASSHSYDVALFDVQGSAPGATIGIRTTRVADGEPAMQVAYGADNFDLSQSLLKQSALYAVASRQQVNATVARYAHQILTSESGAGRESAGGGDSGGPLFTPINAQTWAVVGVAVATNSHSTSAPDPATSGYARMSNVSRWISTPHNGSAALNGIGFLQNVTFRQCMAYASSTSGNRGRLYECEGNNQAVHSQLWQMTTSGGFQKFTTLVNGANLCLGVNSGTNDVALQSCTTSTSQQWVVAAFNGSGNFRTVKNRARNLYLTATSSNGNLAVSGNTESTWLWYR